MVYQKMKINILGGGPSGLYFAYLANKYLTHVDIQVFERNAPDATFGFGVVLAGAGLARLEQADQESFERLRAITKSLGNQEIILDGEVVSIGGGAYGGAVERLQLLKVLQSLCAESGIPVHHNHDVVNVAEIEEADLVVGADGANSTLRRAYPDAFGTHGGRLSNAFAWYGAEMQHPGPTLSFRHAGGGAFCAHYYPYTDRMCTVVMECDQAAWEGGLEHMSNEQRQAFVEELYAEDLNGAPLVSNKSDWRNFEPVWNDRWTHGHRVLIGDAVRRAHFSIGSGTRIAMEDSIALVKALAAESNVENALSAYVAQRKPAADKLIGAAEESYTWFEDMGRYMQAHSALSFAFDYLTRTHRVDEARMNSDYPEFMRALRSERGGVDV